MSQTSAATPRRRLHIAINAWRDTGHHLAGGSEVMIDQLAAGLARRGHRVELRAGGPITDHPYRVRDGGGRFSQYLTMPAAHVRYQRHADLVVDVANGMTFYSPLWRSGPTICFVHHVHTAQWSQWFSPAVAGLGRALERHAMPAAYASSPFVTVSPSSAEALIDLGVAPDRIHIVPNGVDLPETVGEKSPEPLFLAVGRLVPHKRYDLLARLWHQVQPIVGGRLVIVGDGPEEERISALGVPGLELTGRISAEARDRLYAQAWLLLHPSMLEGWGLVVMEAAAHGTPTLAFDAPGVRDSVVSSRTGLLARDEHEMVEMWTDLAQTPDLRLKLGDGARERAEAFSWDSTVERFEEIAYATIEAGRLPRSRRRARRTLTQAAPPTSLRVAPDAPPTSLRVAQQTPPASLRVAQQTPPTSLRVAQQAPPASLRVAPDAPPTSLRVAPDAPPDGAPPLPGVVQLLKLFLHEKTDPDPFYEALALRSIATFRHPFAGRRVLDLGCGHGYDTLAMRAAGAEVVALDMDREKLLATGTPLEGGVRGDATRLPFADGAFDGVYCSNLLEHTPETPPIFDEIERVLRPGGWAWVSWTNWYSPWGGHEIVPLHLLGPDLGLRLWRRFFGEPRVNVPYVELWPTYIGRILADVRRRPGLRLVDATPRYWSGQRWILKVPGLREVATWNCVLELERPR